MTVEQLIHKLQKCDMKDLVVLSADPEGNEYRECSDVDDSMCFLDGDVGHKELTKSLIQQGYTEEDLASEDFKSCVILWP